MEGDNKNFSGRISGAGKSFKENIHPALSTNNYSSETGILFRPGENCWRVERAQRVALLVDGENYFGALHEALCNAQRCVRILAWDLYSKMDLLRGTGETTNYPTKIYDLLESLLKEREQLHVYILLWDFSMIYAFEREWSSLVTLRWNSHPRLHFKLDSKHPFGGSQHQKVVTVDDRIAFVGGFDIAHSRWDSRDHKPDDFRRNFNSGHNYPPFHDMQMLVDGKVAAAMAELARYRWEQVNGEAAQAVDPGARDPWPPSVRPLFTDMDIAIARTLPEYGRRTQAVHEVERLFLDMIERAEQFIYIENQYFTSTSITNALGEILQSDRGAEVVIVLPQHTGLKEQITMDVIRARLLRRLCDLDKHDRLRIYVPADPGLAKGTCMKVHAKLMYVDHRYLRVGSANLSGRSMGLDSECDLALEMTRPDEQQAGREFLYDLLAEHLAVEPARVREVDAQTQSLIKTIETLYNPGCKTLERLKIASNFSYEEMQISEELIDPPSPWDPERFIGELEPHEGGDEPNRSPWLRWIKPLAFLALLAALIAAWRYTPLAEWITIDELRSRLQAIEQYRFSGVLIVLSFAALATSGVPLTALIVAAGLMAGPWVGFAYAMAGGFISAMILFAIGRWLTARKGHTGEALTGRFGGLIKKLREHSILTTVTVRIVPVAPFVVVCTVAGAARLRWRDYFIGSLIGSIPGTAMLTIFAGGLRRALINPSAGTIIALVVIVIMLLVLGWALRHKFTEFLNK
ncbi:MAG TPA: VTT domain-containing protein [Gammaproteobacteria bacterium]